MRWHGCLLAMGIAAAMLILGGQALSARAAGTVGNGTPESCTDTAFLDELAGGGLVLFDCGPNPITITLFMGDGINPEPNTTIDGGTLGQITLSGAGSERLFQLTAGDTLTLTNLVLADGYAGAPGGAIYSVGGALVLDHVIIRDSQAQQTVYGGGAIYNNFGVVSVRHSQFLSNDSAGGGAIYNDASGALFVSNTSFVGNVSHALYGGAITNLGVISMTGGLFQGNVVTFTGAYPYTIGGGAIANYSGGTLQLDDVTLIDNQTGLALGLDWVGGAILNNGVARITNSRMYGNRSLRGGGLYNYASATLTDTVITGNAAVLGGGIFNQEGTLSVRGGSLSANTASTHGGGLYTGWNLDSVTASFSGTAARDNQAGQNGGGFYVYKGMLNLSGARVESNHAGIDGGGLYVYSAGLRAVDSTVRANTAATGDGGGILTYVPVSLAGVTVAQNAAGHDGGGLGNLGGAASWFTNTTFSGNTAVHYGGGLYNTGQLNLRHVTLAYNGASAGGGLYNYNFAGVTAVFTNTVVANSPQGGNCFGAALPAKYSLDSDSTCAFTGVGNLAGVDPLLTALGNYGGPTWTHMLGTGSPALNAVVGSDAVLTDQRGKPRPVGAYDIGAVERQATDTDLAARVWVPLVMR